MKTYNKSLKPTVTHVTPFAEKAKLAPRYGGLVPPLCWRNAGLYSTMIHISTDQVHSASPTCVAGKHRVYQSTDFMARVRKRSSIEKRMVK